MTAERKRLAVSRNYQLIIYVYAAVGARAHLPLSPFVDGVPRVRAEYITTHSYVRARIPGLASKARRADRV